jgi:5-dehydro-2-deoxygluconokinase
MAGFLRGWLRGEPVETCCTWGNACGAIVVSRHGCAPAMPTWPELQLFLSKRDRPFRLRDDTELESLHWATTRRRAYDNLTVLAIDHRSQFEDLAEELGVGLDRVSRFMELALAAVDRVAEGHEEFGILRDGRYGADALAAAADRPYWIGRPIELPRSRPLDFEGAGSVAAELRDWPLGQVVKCLVFCHPDDEPVLREAQEAQVKRLFEAARRTRHELLIEIIPPEGLPVDSETVARAIRRFYAIGVRPDWWKLEPQADPAAWRHIEAAVRENDPECRGILLLGLSSPMDELIDSFPAAAMVPSVKGFAVGRTIFYDVARQWMAGDIDDAAAIDALASRLSELAEAWRSARASARPEVAA